MWDEINWEYLAVVDEAVSIATRQIKKDEDKKMNITCTIKLGDQWLKNMDGTAHQPVTTKSKKSAARVDYKTAVQMVNALQWFGYTAEIVEI